MKISFFSKKIIYIISSIFVVSIIILSIIFAVNMSDKNTYKDSKYSVKLDTSSLMTFEDSCSFKLDFFDNNKKPISILNFLNNYDNIKNGATHNILDLILINTKNNSVDFSYGVYLWGIYKKGKETEIDNASDLIPGKKVYSQSPGWSEYKKTNYFFDSYSFKGLNSNTKYNVEAYIFNTSVDKPIRNEKYKINDNSPSLTTKGSYKLDFSPESSKSILNAALLMGKYDTFSNYEAILPKTYYLLVTYFNYSNNSYGFGIAYSSDSNADPKINGQKDIGSLSLAKAPVLQKEDKNSKEISVDFAKSYPDSFFPASITSYRLCAYLSSWTLNQAIFVGSND